jgi:hypothetical protein
MSIPIIMPPDDPTSSLNYNLTVAQLMTNAARIAGGRSDNQPLTGEQLNTGLFLLNNILAEWGESGIYVFFLNTLEFITTTPKLDYFIGNSPEFDINTNPFNMINWFTYNQGDITYTTKPITRKRFDAISLKNITTFAYVFTYEVYNEYTIFRTFPRLPEGFYLKIVGKQRFTNFNTFDTLTNFPRYANNALMYSLASLFSDIYGWEPAANFNSKLTGYMTTLSNNNKNDFEIETEQPFLQYLPFGGNTRSFYG